MLEKQVLKINGHDIFVEAGGQAQPTMIVLLHHGIGSNTAWRYSVPVLLERGWYVVNYDRWGFGQSGERPGLSTPEFHEDIEDLFALINYFRGKRVILIGHSDGATIGAYFAACHPELIAGFISIAAHIYVESKMEAGIIAVKENFNQDPRFRAGLQRIHGKRYQQVFDNWFYGWLAPKNMNWDMRPVLHSICCPTLIIQGDQDEHATVRHAQDMAAAIPGAELCLVPGGKHMFPQENPDEFNRLLLKFLELRCSIKS